MKKTINGPPSQERERPALDPDVREQQMIALAIDLAEKQLREGTASQQLIVHYLKLATARERIERRQKELENELLIAKTEALQNAKRTDEMYEEAIAAMKRYSGYSGNEVVR